jgi:Ca2+-binding RTX toxin-like protein
MTTINGTTGNDTLSSTGLGDTLIGGNGDDVYIVNDINDIVVEQDVAPAVNQGKITRATDYAEYLGSSINYDDYALSPDAKKIYFTSPVSNLVAGDNNGVVDIFAKDLVTGVVTRLSTAANGAQGNGFSDQLHLSDDGSKLIFRSYASNLVAGDTNNALDIFVKDLKTGTITRVSTDSHGAQIFGHSVNPTISADGTKVAFTIYSATMLPDGSSHTYENVVYAKDLVTGVISLVSSYHDNVRVSVESYNSMISKDGKSVIFESIASYDTSVWSYTQNVYVKTLSTGAVTLVSATDDGQPGYLDSGQSVISNDGRKVAFISQSQDFVDAYYYNYPEIFVKDLVTGAINLVSTDNHGRNIGVVSNTPIFSPDGTKIYFETGSVYEKDLITGVLTDLGTNSLGVPANGYVANLQLSADGTKLAFVSNANNLASGSHNGEENIFIKDLPVSTGDSVRASVSYTLSANVEKLILTGAANIYGSGNALDNTLIGNDGNNTLNGGAGIDTLAGGLGNDTYVIDTLTDVVTEWNHAGTDTVKCSVTGYTLDANIENLVLTGTANISGTGNNLANTLNGNSGNNTLDGGDGIDTLVGGLGDDVYMLNLDSLGRKVTTDTVIEGVNGGTDTVIASMDYTLGANVENLTFTGHGLSHNGATLADYHGVGNNLANLIIGNDHKNLLDGGKGNDTLVGGLGNDSYIVDSSLDVVTEDANAGTDSITASVSFVLGANVENLALTGTDNLNGTGNALNNDLSGNSGRNLLSAGAGNDFLAGGGGVDTLVGGLGNDTYYVDNASDSIVESANSGLDSVQSTVSYTLAANVENLTLTFASTLTANINGVGNALANVITGNQGNNILNGNGGDDRLIGAGGDDTYVVTDVKDIIVEYANGGVDLVQSSGSYTLGGTYAENLILTGSATANGTGNFLANIIRGNNGDNVLSGGAGNDTLTGGLGNDAFLFNTALSATANKDTITDLSAGETLQLNHLIFTQLGAAGSLAGSLFKAGAGLTSGQGTDDRIVYNTTTGNLYYDADGSGAGASILFAQLGTTTHPSLTAAVIQVV